MVDSYEVNKSKLRLYNLGIGSGVDSEFIKSTAKLGKGN